MKKLKNKEKRIKHTARLDKNKQNEPSDEDIYEYDSDESADDYDENKWDPNMEVYFKVYFWCTSRKQAKNVCQILEEKGFTVKSPYHESYASWSCSAGYEMKVKEAPSMWSIVQDLMCENNAFCQTYYLEPISWYE